MCGAAPPRVLFTSGQVSETGLEGEGREGKKGKAGGRREGREGR